MWELPGPQRNSSLRPGALRFGIHRDWAVAEPPPVNPVLFNGTPDPYNSNSVLYDTIGVNHRLGNRPGCTAVRSLAANNGN